MNADEKQKLLTELEALRRKNAEMRQLATANGFREFYFNQLPYFKSNTEAFNHVNNLYLEYFGEYRYSSHDTFRKLLHRFCKQ